MPTATKKKRKDQDGRAIADRIGRVMNDRGLGARELTRRVSPMRPDFKYDTFMSRLKRGSQIPLEDLAAIARTVSIDLEELVGEERINLVLDSIGGDMISKRFGGAYSFIRDSEDPSIRRRVVPLDSYKEIIGHLGLIEHWASRLHKHSKSKQIEMQQMILDGVASVRRIVLSKIEIDENGKDV